jgi:preprotein translocase subunit SecF
MEILRETNIDFMKYRKFWVVISLALVAVGIFSIFVHGKLNVGIDFAGGTQINFKFQGPPEIDRLRSIVGGAGFDEAVIQRFGDEDQNEVIVKTRLIGEVEEGTRDPIVAALERELNPDAQGDFDLNRVGVERIEQALVAADPDGRVAQGEVEMGARYQEVAEAILEKRRDQGIFTSWEEIGAIPAVSPQAFQALQQEGYLGQFAILGVENVGPQIGGELRRQGFLAVALSLLGMIGYIWIRFELRFGVGAVMAVLHDITVTLGFFALAGFEFNLTTIAAFLTLIGYSVNDSVVIFDRIRENMRKNRRKPLVDTMNESINQTLSRTLLTGGSTLLAVGALYFLGGEVLKGFAFIMVVGVLVGTYSSIYVASPFALLWQQLLESRGRRPSGRAERPAVEPPAAAAGESRRPARRA